MTSASVQPLCRIKSAVDPAQLDVIRDHEQAVLVFGPGAVAREVIAALDV